jgi:hypothetical protein
MHQHAQKKSQGYFHMQFFEGKTATDDSLEALDQLLQSFIQEGIDLKRVTLLTRYAYEAALIAKFLTERNYSVQSAAGLQVSSHPTVKTIINLLKDDWQTENSLAQNAIHQFYGVLSQEQINSLLQTRALPLYQRIQSIIEILHLSEIEGATPYLTAFQDIIYNFTNSRVANTQAFLQYWERKAERFTIPAAKANNTIQIMTIHSSKGLEFDIVILPMLSWPIVSFHQTDILWCEPQKAPFNALPLVAVHPTNLLKQSHFKQEYLQEMVAQYMDNLNLTYVALTRPKYRLYAFGEKYKTKQNGEVSINHIGHLFSYLYDNNGELNEQLIYSRTQDGSDYLPPLPPLKTTADNNTIAQYVSVPINERLVLRSRSEDDFDEQAPLTIVDLGTLMHLWLANIRNWEDNDKALQRLIDGGQVTHKQAIEMRKQMIGLQELISHYNHNDWFSDEYQILTEQDIITTSKNTYRPDRVMMKNKHAIIIDYKFGQKERKSHLEQVRNYMLLLQQMGYTVEGHIVYNALQKIITIS